MNQYINEVTVEDPLTLVTSSIKECKSHLNINAYNNKFSLIHFNISSIAKHFDELLVFLNEFKDYFDCIVLTETWEIKNKNLFNIPGYESIYSGKPVNQNDGIVVYIHKKHKIESNIEEVGILRVVKTKILSYKRHITITAVYRLHCVDKNVFIEDLENYLQTLHRSDIQILVGDININIRETNQIVGDYLNVLSQLGFKSYINESTRIEGQTKTCIDHIFMKNNFVHDNEVKAMIIESKITDHYPIIINFNASQEKTEQTQHSTKSVDYKKLELLARREDWVSNFSQNTNVDNMSEILTTKIKKIMDRATRQKILPTLHNKKPWITSEMILWMNTRDKLFREHKKFPNNEELFKKYKTQRNKVTNTITNEKYKYYKKIVLENRNNPKVLWSTVNEFSGKHKKSQTVELKEIKTEDNSIITDKLDIANVFVNHYSTVGEKMAQKIRQEALEVIPQNVNTVDDTIFLTPCDEAEILNIIKELKTNTAPGYDGISVKIIKTLAEYIAKPLCILINAIFATGICPSNFKITIVKPVFKSGEKNKVINYRPVSIISNLAKIFEKILKKRLMAFTETHQIISDFQFGFQNGRSTSDAIVNLVTQIYEHIDKKRACLGVFIDLAKAFDTISHEKLLSKLNNLGIRGLANVLIRNYLNERVQMVKIDGVLSDPLQIKYGIPQGTVLGPILFILYLNDMLSIDISGKVVSYADDTALIIDGSTWEDVISHTRKDIDTIVNWLDDSLLTINIDKTSYIPFCSNRHDFPNAQNINIHLTSRNKNITLKKSNSVKYLGIHIDQNLKWKIHIDYLCKRLRALLYVFRTLKNILSINDLRSIYFSLVQSLLMYGNLGWGGVYSTTVQPLMVLQKRFLKIIYNLNFRFPSAQIFQHCELMSLRYLYFKQLLIYIFHNRNKFKNHQHGHETRLKASNLDIPKMNKAIGQRSITYIGPKLFNLAPDHIKTEYVFKLFKISMIKWLKNENITLL